MSVSSKKKFNGISWYKIPDIRDEVIEKMRKSKRGEKNPMWKGNNVINLLAGNRRAQRLLNTPVGKEIHHIDGNPLNNDPSNLEFLTRKEHMIKDGRMKKLIDRNKKGGKNNAV